MPALISHNQYPFAAGRPAEEVLAVLERLFQPEAAPAERLAAEVIRTLARYLRYVPITTSSQDLDILLAVSVVLAREARR